MDSAHCRKFFCYITAQGMISYIEKATMTISIMILCLFSEIYFDNYQDEDTPCARP